MTIFDNCYTYFLSNGNVLFCYDNGYHIRKGIDRACGITVSGQHLGYRRWKKEALQYLGLTIDDIICRCKGKIAFKD